MASLKNPLDDESLLIENEESESNQDAGQPNSVEEVENGATSRHGEDVSIFWIILGIFLVISAGFTFTASNVIQKFYLQSLTFWQLLLHRSIVQTSIMAIVCGAQGIRHSKSPLEAFFGPPEVRKRTVLQGIFGGLLLLCLFNGIRHVPLGNISAIIFCTPVFTFLFAPCMLRENCGLYRSMIAMLMVGGVVLITRPQFVFGPYSPQVNVTNETFLPDVNADSSFELVTYLGYASAVGVPLLSAFISLLTRQCKHVPPYILMLWFGTGGLIVSSISVVILRPEHLFDMSVTEWLFTLLIIAFGIFGNLCYTFAVRWVSPTKANVFRSFEVILNFVLQLHFENTPFYPENAVGIVLLISAVIIISYESEVIKHFHKCRFI